MRYVFLDNFRGFCNTTIPLTDVNFLVGENSTGKTSLLTTLRMFSNPRLFTSIEFPGDDARPSPFSELVSAHAQDQTFFRLGLVDERPKMNETIRSSVRGMLLTYQGAQRGLPELAYVTCSFPGREVSLKFDGGKVFCKFAAAREYRSAREMSERFPEWAAHHDGGVAGWTEVTQPGGSKNGHYTLILLLSMAWTGPSSPPAEFPLAATGLQVVWIAPIRAGVRRTYDEPHTAYSAEGSHTPYVIRRMLGSAVEATRFREYMERVGRASGLFEKIEVKIFGNREDPQAPFEVDAWLDDRALSLGWLGYGVSQSLPILVELLDRPAGSWFAIQQPEVHLHPRAQASLGDVFFEMAAGDDKKFLIETHSDFLIDRFRMNYRRKRSRKDRAALPQSQILFFERRNGQNTVVPLQIGPRGELPADQPDSYRDFFISEQMDLLDA